MKLPQIGMENSTSKFPSHGSMTRARSKSPCQDMSAQLSVHFNVKNSKIHQDSPYIPLYPTPVRQEQSDQQRRQSPPDEYLDVSNQETPLEKK